MAPLPSPSAASGHTCVPFLPPAKAKNVVDSVNQHCPRGCMGPTPCMVGSSDAHATLWMVPRANATSREAALEAAVFLPDRERALLAAALKRDAAQLLVTGPVQDGFWVRATVLFAQRGRRRIHEPTSRWAPAALLRAPT